LTVKTRVNETFSRPFFTGYMANFSACELSLGNRSTTSFYGKFLITYSDLVVLYLFSALTLLVGRQEGHPAHEKLGVGVGLLVVTV